MSDGPLLLYAGLYASYADAQEDYEVLLDRHARGSIGTYRAGIASKYAGEVHVERRRKGHGHLIGHFSPGMSRQERKGLADLLDEGQAAIVMLGESQVGELMDKTLTRAQKLVERESEATSEDALEQEIRQAANELTAS
jgi:hypothetical protein